jgi:hypothetical protein
LATWLLALNPNYPESLRFRLSRIVVFQNLTPPASSLMILKEARASFEPDRRIFKI